MWRPFLLAALFVCIYCTSDLEERFLRVPNATSCREHHREITEFPHIAGTVQQKAVAEYIMREMLAAGIPHVELREFEAMMTYPLSASVSITSPPEFVYEASLIEDVIPEDPSTGDPDIVATFNGYAPSGTASGELAYVNYAEESDFEALLTAGVNVSGAVCICRYGRVFRGLKAQMASRYGCTGLIVYSDPQQDGFTRGDVYPEGPWRPESGTQRGSMLFLSTCPGDPARQPNCWGNDGPMEGNIIPDIPVQPMGYGDAIHFLRALDGPLGGDIGGSHWVGGLDIDYHVGVGPAVVELSSQNDRQDVMLYNVIATIPGSGDVGEQIVMAGNHIDAWTFGAVDPSSGTAAMLETARGLGALLAEGWQPKRTIQLAGWDGEEYGLVGSVFHGEDALFPTNDVVAYLNLDSAVGGPQFGGSGVPSLEKLMVEATRDVPYPHGGTVLDNWRGEAEQPSFGRLGSGSDYTVFLDHLGIPCTDMGFGGISGGIYHSAYDTHHFMTQFGDPEFELMTTAAKILGIMLIRLTESEVLPLDYVNYANELTTYKNEVSALAESLGAGLDLSALEDSIKEFADAADTIPTEMDDKHEDVNSKLMMAERHFLDDAGLEDRPWYKHLIVAPGLQTGYAADVFPGIQQALREGNTALAQAEVGRAAAVVSASASALEYKERSGLSGLVIGLIIGGSALLLISVGVATYAWKRSNSRTSTKRDGVPLLSAKGAATYGA